MDFVSIIIIILSMITRLEALRTWKTKNSFRATYGNLLELFVEAGHTHCAEVLCDLLRKKSEFIFWKWAYLNYSIFTRQTPHLMTNQSMVNIALTVNTELVMFITACMFISDVLVQFCNQFLLSLTLS